MGEVPAAHITKESCKDCESPSIFPSYDAIFKDMPRYVRKRGLIAASTNLPTSDRMQKSEVLFAFGVVIIVIGALFGGFMLSNLAAGNSGTGSGKGGAGSYDLTIVITTNNWFNSTIGYEPAFYVLQNSQLVSSGNISLPANVPIHLTIINYDNGAAATDSQFANVTGTQGNVVFIMNDTSINSTQPSNPSSGISVVAGQPVSFVNDSDISHTFTVQLGSTTVLNIPIEPSAVESATFTLASGTYAWHCMAACGSGSTGWAGAMDTPDWMGGSVNVS